MLVRSLYIYTCITKLVQLALKEEQLHLRHHKERKVIKLLFCH